MQVGPSRFLMLGISGTTALGLIKLNVTGVGVTEAIKSLWRPKAE